MSTRHNTWSTRALILLLLWALLLPVGLGSPVPSPVRAQSGFDCGDVTQILQGECEALVALYNATDGDNWTDNTDWLVTNTPCDWHGVGCDGGNVTEIVLYNNQLSGPIPPQIGDLSALTWLSLANNELSGPIPPQIGDLTALEFLHLQRNQLSGSIPPEVGDLTALRELDLANNQLSDPIPPEIGNLSALTWLNLSWTQLSGPIPPEIGNLTALRSLHLRDNELSGPIPTEIGDLSALTSLSLHNNELSGELPVALTHLNELALFYFHDTELCVPPSGPVPEWLDGIDDVQGTGLVCDDVQSHRGTMAVSAPPSPMAYEPLPGTAWVRNTGSHDSQFTLLIELQQNGQLIESYTALLTVPAGARHTHPFQLDPQEDGYYQLRASLSVDGDMLDTATQHIAVVLSPDRRAALLAAQQLEDAAMREFDRARGIVFEAYVESVLQLPEEAAKAVLGSLDPIGDALGFAESHLLATKVGTWLAGLDDIIDTDARPPVEEWVREHPLRALDDALTQERQQVMAETDQFNEWVRSNDIVWQGGILTNEYIGTLGSRVENEKMWGVAPPPYVLAGLSLSQQQLNFLVYEGLGVGLDWLVIVSALAVLFLLIFTTGPAAGAFLAKLGALQRVGLEILSVGAGVMLLLIAMVMHLQVETGVAPAITNTHAEALNALRSSLSAGTLTADQRPLAAQASQASDRQQQTHAMQRGPDSGSEQDTALTLTSSDVSLSLDIAQPQLALNQTLEATIGITNTLVTTGTGEITLLVQSTGGENVAVWPVELESGASDHFDFSFVPDSAGSYVVRASVMDGWGEPLGFEEAGYVVGNGPALSINIDCAPTHSPETDVTLSLKATNDGNEPASPLITLVTIDEETGTSIYTQTLSIPLEPESEVTSVTTVLTDALPGEYRVNLALDGTPYHHPHFVVSARDILRAETWFDHPSPALGETMTLSARIVDSGGHLADAALTLEVLDPEGFSESLSVTRVATGTYQATYSPVLSGTQDVNLTADRPGWRGAQVADAFAVEQPSPLVPDITGTLQAGQVNTVTVSVTNARNVPVPGASVTLSGMDHQLHDVTDAAGRASFWVSPRSTEDYQVRIQKLGYARTTTSLSLDNQIARLYLPLVMRSYSPTTDPSSR